MTEKLTLKNRICDRKPEHGGKDIMFKANLCQGICMMEYPHHVKYDLSYKGMEKSTLNDRSVTCGKDVFPDWRPGRKLIQCVKTFKRSSVSKLSTCTKRLDFENRKLEYIQLLFGFA